MAAPTTPDGSPREGAPSAAPLPGERLRDASAMEGSFGYAPAAGAADKQRRVDDVFHSVARRYDVMNDLMSAGMHRVWKDALVTKANPSRRRDRPGGPWRGLDVAGGTGDVAFRLVERSNRAAHVTCSDINASMLDVGRRRAERRGLLPNLDFVEANAEALPFADGTFDCYTIAFGIRNVPRIARGLAEAHRVLKPGGRFLCLEFSAVDVPVLEQLYERWSFDVIPRIGRLVTGDADSYRYLVESIRRFPDQEAFAETIREAGFERVDHTNLTGGVVAIHSGWKL